MQPNQILAADLLDILFDGRNKDYGAYQLRRDYNRRMKLAMLSVLLLVSTPVIIFLITGKKEIMPPVTHVGRVIDLPPAIDPPETILSAPAKKIRPVKTIQSAVIKIVADKDFKEADKPPTQMELDKDVKIGLADMDGDPAVTIAPSGDGVSGTNGEDTKGDIAGANGDNKDEGFIPMEIESEYPGGPKAWARFLNRMLGNNYPPEAFENGVQGTVLIQFIVDIDGTVSNIEAISGPEELRVAAINTIRKSGKWNPAIQNGKNVKTYKRQPITFVLQGE
jgi:protein TonB